jgi:hypothetical protein
MAEDGCTAFGGASERLQGDTEQSPTLKPRGAPHAKREGASSRGCGQACRCQGDEP